MIVYLWALSCGNQGDMRVLLQHGYGHAIAMLPS